MQDNIFLKEQILTYLGNKRSLLDFISKGVNIAKNELKKDALECADIFSGSGIVARFLKQHSNFLIANDLELYSKIINECYLFNPSFEFERELLNLHLKLIKDINNNLHEGFITKLYAPNDDLNILPNERVFYTKKNAMYIDTARSLIEELPIEFRNFFIAPLLFEASNKANTSGVFKGFYKNSTGVGQFGGEGRNALGRIMSDISLPYPIFSKFNVDFFVYQKDANILCEDLKPLDLVYLDPPYNQHPYGSNYFMLNLIAKYEEPKEISQVSGIEQNWNRSIYNKKSASSKAFFELIEKLKAKFVLISFNSEGFISKKDFEKELGRFGKVKILRQKYNAFRASRNLENRSLHVTEFLYVLKKN